MQHSCVKIEYVTHYIQLGLPQNLSSIRALDNQEKENEKEKTFQNKVLFITSYYNCSTEMKAWEGWSSIKKFQKLLYLSLHLICN